MARTGAIERGTAVERREQVLDAALHEFAARGYEATTTQAIAARAGLSQAYLFRLFGSKRELFLRVADRVFERVGETLAEAAGRASGEPAERLATMGQAYRALLEDRELLRAQMHLYAACAEPEVGELARRRYGELVAEVARLSGADADAVWRFFATGMLLNVAAAMDLPELADQDAWSRLCQGL